MRRGEIWLINLDPTIGSEIRKTRPAVIVNDDAVGCRFVSGQVCLSRTVYPQIGHPLIANDGCNWRISGSCLKPETIITYLPLRTPT